MRYSQDKNINTVVKDLIDVGWKAVKKKRHWQLMSPIGRVLTVPSTPSDIRAVKNFICDVRRK